MTRSKQHIGRKTIPRDVVVKQLARIFIAGGEAVDMKLFAMSPLTSMRDVINSKEITGLSDHERTTWTRGGHSDPLTSTT